MNAKLTSRAWTMLAATVVALGATAGTSLGDGLSARVGGPAPGRPNADFSVLGATASGQTLAINLPAARDVAAAVSQTGEALQKKFDGRPTLSSGFADSKTKGRGGALFTAKLNGKDIRGWIFCSAAKEGLNKGMMSTVVYAPADADKSAVATLFAYLPVDQKMETHKFPDGSGSVDLPPGWTTEQQGLAHGVLIKGPAGQTAVVGLMISVCTPDGMLAKLRMQNYRMAVQNYQSMMQMRQQMIDRQRSMPNMPPMQMLPEPMPPAEPNFEKDMPGVIFCRLCDGPEDVLKYFFPVMEKKGKDAGTVYSHLDEVLSIKPVDPNTLMQGQKAGVCDLKLTDYDGGKATSIRAMARIDTGPVGDGKDNWIIGLNYVRAPEGIFDRDLPVMNAILSSIKYNMDVINKQRAEEMETSRKISEENTRAIIKRGNDFRRQQKESFEQNQAQHAARQRVNDDANADFNEMIRGVRDVYDTKTGEMHSVDLYNVNGIVNGMNDATNDPNRFVQVPLRYQR